MRSWKIRKKVLPYYIYIYVRMYVYADIDYLHYTKHKVIKVVALI